MDSILEKLKAEPVRVRLYTIIGLIAAYLMLKGLVNADDVSFIVAMAASVLGVETARAKVKPVAKHVPKHRA